MKPRNVIGMLSIAFGLLATPAHAYAGETEAKAFVEREHVRLTTILREPAGAARDAKVTQALGSMVDYNTLTQRAFGSPCPVGVSGCTNHWNDLTQAQKDEVKGLLQKLVEKNYKKNLEKTLNYTISYRGSKTTGGELRVLTSAENRLKPREAPVRVDYVVLEEGSAPHVVDILTEGSSLTKNYYEQFHKMLTTKDQGYPYVVKRLEAKIAAP